MGWETSKALLETWKISSRTFTDARKRRKRMGKNMKNNGRKIFYATVFLILANLPFLALAGTAGSQR
ncbi:hypothetical protein BH24DEI2_BH24DEI2_22530 [soil metagenome]